MRRTQESVRGEGDAMKEAERGVMPFEIGGGPPATSQGTRAPLEAENGRETNFPL